MVVRDIHGYFAALSIAAEAKGKLGKAAKALLKLTDPQPQAQRQRVADAALAGRLERAERWQRNADGLDDTQ